MISKPQLLSLYRLYFTITRQCPDRSLKLYIRRRAKEDFRSLSSLQPEQANIEVQRLQSELEIVRRQMAVRTLYFC